MSGRIKTKRFNETVEGDDGYRLLVTRYRPRYVRKTEEPWDEWRKDLGPSRELLASFQGKNGPAISWPEYRERYLLEMEEQASAVRQLAELVRSGETLTVLCSSACKDPETCHRTVLRDLILAEVERSEVG